MCALWNAALRLLAGLRYCCCVQTAATTGGDEKWMVFGRTGWLGGKLIKMLEAEGKAVVGAKSRLENRSDVAA